MGSGQPVPEYGNKGQISGWHGVVSQGARADPFEGLALATARRSLPFPAGKERHQQVEFVIAVARESERR